MMPSIDQLRYETKFVASPIELPTLERWILSHPAGFRSAFPPRRVNSLYFDDWGLSAYSENLSGVSERTKVRFRWYGDAAARVDGQLELKCKRNRAGWKISHAIRSLPFLGESWRAVLSAMREQLPPEMRVSLDTHPQVVMINRYWRRYFVSHDRRVRVTVDTDQVVFDQRRSAGPQLTHAANLPDAVILEVKGPVDDHARLDRMVQSIPVRASRHSKYVVGVQAIAAS